MEVAKTMAKRTILTCIRHRNDYFELSTMSENTLAPLLEIFVAADYGHVHSDVVHIRVLLRFLAPHLSKLHVVASM